MGRTRDYVSKSGELRGKVKGRFGLVALILAYTLVDISLLLAGPRGRGLAISRLTTISQVIEYLTMRF